MMSLGALGRVVGRAAGYLQIPGGRELAFEAKRF